MARFACARHISCIVLSRLSLFARLAQGEKLDKFIKLPVSPTDWRAVLGFVAGVGIAVLILRNVPFLPAKFRP